MRRRGWVRGQAKKKTDGETTQRPAPPQPRSERRPVSAPPLRPYRAGTNGQDRSHPVTVRMGPPTQAGPRTRATTQPVTQPPVEPEGLRKSRMRSAAASARARLAGLAGQVAYKPPEPAPPAPDKSSRTTAPTLLHHPEGALSGNVPPVTPRIVGGPAQGRPPPLPHQMLPSEKPSPAAAPLAQAQANARAAARPRTKPPNLDVLPPQIKASLEKLAGGPVNLEPQVEDDGPPTDDGEPPTSPHWRRRKATT